MKRLIKQILLTCCLLILLIMGFLVFLVTTTPGLYSAIKLTQLYIPGELAAEGLKGRLLTQFSIENLRYKKDNMQIKISYLHMDSFLKYILLGHTPVAQLDIAQLDLQQDAKAHTIKDIHLHGLFKNQILNLDALELQTLNYNISSHASINVQTPYQVNSVLKFQPQMPQKHGLKGTLSIAGNKELMQWNGDFSGPANLSIQGKVLHASKIEQLIKWQNLKLSDVSSPTGSLKISGTLAKTELELASKIKTNTDEHWQLVATAQGSLLWSWIFDVKAVQSEGKNSTKPGLYGSFSAHGQIKNLQQGSLVLKLAPGHYQMPEGSSISSLAFQGGSFTLKLNPKQLQAKGTLVLNKGQNLDLTFKLPQFDIVKGLRPNQALEAHGSLVFDSLSFLNNIHPEFKNPQGQLHLSLDITGTIAKHDIKNTLDLTKGAIELPSLGLNLNQIQAHVIGRKNKWQGNASINSGGNILTLEGKGLFIPELQGQALIKGSEFLLMNTPEYVIKVSPQLTLQFTKNLVSINGHIIVPYAHIKPLTFFNSLDLSEDVIFEKNKELPKAAPFNSEINIQLDMGKEVDVIFRGLKAQLAGTVHLKQKMPTPLNATGELDVVKGQYKAYGQDLSIDQGELIFTGGALDNPGINLRASKHVDMSSAPTSSGQLLDLNSNNLQNAAINGSFDVGVEVSGRIKQPKIQLFSEPSILSQADILSMLILGKPANQANKAGGQLLFKAISSMSLDGGTNGTQLLDQLKKNIGIDFNMETTSNYDAETNTVQDKRAIVLSKPISKRISLSYNIGLSQSNPNVLVLNYLINKFFSIQVSNSVTSNGIDLLYTSSKKDKL